MESVDEHERCRPPARLHPPQGRLPQAAAPHRGPGPRPAAHGRGREVLHRHPHPGLGHDEGAAVGRPRPARGAPEPLRRRGRARPAAARPTRRSARPPRPSPASSAPDHPLPREGIPMSTATYTVVGMTCGHCVSAVTEEVSQVPGVTAVDVDLASGGLTVTSDAPVDEGAVRAAVEEAGYEVAGAEPTPRQRRTAMNTPLKLAGFALGLVAVFGAAAGLGTAVGPVGPAAATAADGRHDTATPATAHDAHGGRRAAGAGRPARRADGLRGRLHPRPRPSRSLPAGDADPAGVPRSSAPTGTPVTDYDVEPRAGPAPHRGPPRPDRLPARAPRPRRRRRLAGPAGARPRLLAALRRLRARPPRREPDPRRRPRGRRRLRARPAARRVARPPRSTATPSSWPAT